MQGDYSYLSNLLILSAHPLYLLYVKSYIPTALNLKWREMGKHLLRLCLVGQFSQSLKKLEMVAWK